MLQKIRGGKTLVNPCHIKRLFFDVETISPFITAATKDYYKSENDNTVVVSEGYILPAVKNISNDGIGYYKGGVVDNSIVKRDGIGGSLLEGYDFDKAKTAIIEKDVLYAGVLINHFGHFLVECTNRLWYWIENREKNWDIAFLMPKNQRIFPQFWQFMELLGIDRTKIHIIKK